MSEHTKYHNDTLNAVSSTGHCDVDSVLVMLTVENYVHKCIIFFINWLSSVKNGVLI
jgi:hypothetical protein